MKRTILIFVASLCFIGLYSQEVKSTMNNQNPRTSHPFGISIGSAYFITAESGILFLSTDYFVLPQISLVANVGITDFEEPYFSIGAKGHLNSTTSTSRFSPFIGALIGHEWYEYMVQVPVGLDYISKRGFNVSLSINQIFYFDSYNGTFIDLKIGWRFKK